MIRVISWFVIFSAPLGCAHHARILANDSLVLKEKYFAIEYQSDMSQDAQIVKSTLLEAFRCLSEYFGEDKFLATQKLIPFRVHIQSLPNDEVNETRAITESGTTNGKLHSYFANLRILGYSRFRQGQASTSSENLDQNYYQKILAHEYSQTWLDVHQRQKLKGWRFSQAPDWYTEGLPEYLAVSCLPEAAHELRTKRYQEKAIEYVVAKRSNPYVIGFSKLKFLHQKFNPATIKSFIDSSLDFESGFKLSFGITVKRFHDDWKSNLLVAK